jgi:hypothetical protein
VSVALMLAAWSGLFAWLLWGDPIAANDSAVLLARSVYADAHQYLPGLFIRHWQDAAPGLAARIAAWLALVALGSWAALRARSVTRVLAGTALVVLALGAALERWPSRRGGPAPPSAMALDEATRVFFDGAVRTRGDEAVLGPGSIGVLVRRIATDGTPVASLRAVVGGSGVLRAEGRPAFALRPSGALVDVPLVPYHVVGGRDGRTASFSRARMAVSGQAVLRIGPPSAGPSGADADEKEPHGAGLR